MFDVHETAHETFPYVRTGDPVCTWGSAGRTAQQSVQANAPDNWYWDSFDDQSLLPNCLSVSYLQISNVTSNDFVGQRVPESFELLYRPAVSAHQNTIESQPGLEMYSGSLYHPNSRSAIVHSAGTSQDSNFGITFTNNMSFEPRSTTVATDPPRTPPAVVSPAPTRKRQKRNESLYTCSKNTPLLIGKGKRPAREIIEDVCRLPALLPNGSERLLKLVEAFEKTYNIPKAAAGSGKPRTKLLRQDFRRSLTRLLVQFFSPDRRNVRYSKPLVNIAKIESSARALSLL
jgi:hypothetical protein